MVIDFRLIDRRCLGVLDKFEGEGFLRGQMGMQYPA